MKVMRTIGRINILENIDDYLLLVTARYTRFASIASVAKDYAPISLRLQGKCAKRDRSHSILSLAFVVVV
jgi:hypothetical protein